jgi:hypothetical protein
MSDEMKIRRIGAEEEGRPAEKRLTTADLAGTSHRVERAEDVTREHDRSSLGQPPANVPVTTPSTGSRPSTGAQTGTAATMAPQRVFNEEPNAPLFTPNDVTDLRSRWDKIQVRFVDEPRECVEQADSLVAETMKRLAESFSKQREDLEQQWHRGGDVSTEDLRLALRRYRSFFGRLMQI